MESLVAIRTAPGHKYCSVAERIMSILNIGFHNTALRLAIAKKDTYSKMGCSPDKELKAQFKTVHPICAECKGKVEKQSPKDHFTPRQLRKQRKHLKDKLAKKSFTSKRYQIIFNNCLVLHRNLL